MKYIQTFLLFLFIIIAGCQNKSLKETSIKIESNPAKYMPLVKELEVLYKQKDSVKKGSEEYKIWTSKFNSAQSRGIEIMNTLSKEDGLEFVKKIREIKEKENLKNGNLIKKNKEFKPIVLNPAKNHIYDCDISILKKRETAIMKNDKENYFGLKLIHRIYMDEINKVSIEHKELADKFIKAMENSKIKEALKANNDLILMYEDFQDFIASKKITPEFEHFENLLYCYFELQITHSNETKNYLNSSITASEKLRITQDYYRKISANDDKKYTEMKTELDNIFKDYKLGSYRYID